MKTQSKALAMGTAALLVLGMSFSAFAATSDEDAYGGDPKMIQRQNEALDAERNPSGMNVAASAPGVNTPVDGKSGGVCLSCLKAKNALAAAEMFDGKYSSKSDVAK